MLSDSSVFFQWNQGENALSYTVEISRYPDFSALYANETGVTNNAYQNDTLSYDKRFFWRVIANYIGGGQDTSSVWSFTHFSPQNISSLQLWLSPDYYLNETGGFIDAWKNKVDTGIVFSQGLSSEPSVQKRFNCFIKQSSSSNI